MRRSRPVLVMTLSMSRLLVESSCCFNQTPFWAPNHTDMYTRVLHDELVFPDERPIDTDTKNFIRGVSLAWFRFMSLFQRWGLT